MRGQQLKNSYSILGSHIFHLKVHQIFNNCKSRRGQNLKIKLELQTPIEPQIIRLNKNSWRLLKWLPRTFNLILFQGKCSKTRSKRFLKIIKIRLKQDLFKLIHNFRSNKLADLTPMWLENNPKLKSTVHESNWFSEASRNHPGVKISITILLKSLLIN